MHERDVAGLALPLLARTVCRRHFSLGADGLLVVGNSNDGLKLQMFNPDGTEDFCGNGLRCAALYAKTLGWIGSESVISHHGRQVLVKIGRDDLVETEIGSASFAPPSIPLAPGCAELFEADLDLGKETIKVSSLSTGSAHTVIFVESLPNDLSFFRLGPLIEDHPWFPEKTSAIWTQVLSPRKLRLRIWERGAGETLGCGTGAAAAAAAHFRREGLGGEVEVANPGGSLLIRMEGWDKPITVIGMAQVVYRGVLPLKQMLGSQKQLSTGASGSD